MSFLTRSYLYVPASNARAVEKARTLSCDGLIFDLEDAVAPEAKEAARASLLVALKLDYGYREVVVRVNALDTKWGEADIAALAHSAASAILLPKVNGAADIRTAAGLLPQSKAIWAMMETPKAIIHAREIAAAGPPLKALVMGLNDLAKDLHVEQTPDRMALLYSLSACVMAARAYGLHILDGVYGNIKDEAGFVTACQQGRALGFDGKTLIHPSQIEAANAAFGPQPVELQHAERIVAAWKAEGHKGVIAVDGEMIEALHVKAAEQTLAMRDAILARQG